MDFYACQSLGFPLSVCLSVCLELQPLRQRNESKLQTPHRIEGCGRQVCVSFERSTRTKRGFPRHSPELHSVFGKVGQGQRYLISFIACKGERGNALSLDFSQLRGLHSNGVGFLCLYLSVPSGGSFNGIESESCNLDFIICVFIQQFLIYKTEWFCRKYIFF